MSTQQHGGERNALPSGSTSFAFPSFIYTAMDNFPAVRNFV